MNFRQALHGGLIGGLLMIQGLQGGVVFAQPTDATRAEARAHFDAGVTAFEARAFADALREFQAAYRIAPHPAVKVNIANCHEQLGNPVAALTHFEEFLAESENPPMAQRTQVERAIERLNEQVGFVRLSVQPPTARVRVDGRAIAPSLLAAPVRLEAGSHSVEARAGGYLTGAREFVVEPGATVDLALSLDAIPAAAEPALSPAPPLRTHDEPEEDDGDWALAPIQPLTVAVGATSLAAAAAAGIVALFASGAENDFEASDRIAQDPTQTPTVRLLAFNQSVADADRAEDLSLLADTIGFAAAAGVVTTGVLAVLDVVQDEDENAYSAFTIEPSVAVSATGVSGNVSLTF